MEISFDFNIWMGLIINKQTVWCIRPRHNSHTSRPIWFSLTRWQSSKTINYYSNSSTRGDSLVQVIKLQLVRLSKQEAHWVKSAKVNLKLSKLYNNSSSLHSGSIEFQGLIITLVRILSNTTHISKMLRTLNYQCSSFSSYRWWNSNSRWISSALTIQPVTRGIILKNKTLILSRQTRVTTLCRAPKNNSTLMPKNLLIVEAVSWCPVQLTLLAVRHVSSLAGGAVSPPHQLTKRIKNLNPQRPLLRTRKPSSRCRGRMKGLDVRRWALRPPRLWMWTAVIQSRQ